MQSGINSVDFVKAYFVEVTQLRAGYSALCWIAGIGAYLGVYVLVNIQSSGTDMYSDIYSVYFLAGGPILIALAIVMLVLRPIYILALCDLYSMHLKRRGHEVLLPDDPPHDVSAIIAFTCFCFVISIVYLYRNELGIMAMLSSH